jgi:hypothetical protein
MVWTNLDGRRTDNAVTKYALSEDMRIKIEVIKSTKAIVGFRFIKTRSSSMHTFQNFPHLPLMAATVGSGKCMTLQKASSRRS